MTAQLLALELSTLIQESKKKHPELRALVKDTILAIYASAPDLQRDLKHRHQFAKPFLLACSTRTAKVAASGIAGLQRLVVANGLPSDSLQDVLVAFRDYASLGLDVQLKVLQALPSLLQNYTANLQGQLLISAFDVCLLLHGSKTAVVANTAAASVQQLFAFAFERIAAEDGQESSIQPIQIVHEAASDAYYLLNDVCLLTEGSEPKVLQRASLSPSFGLELVETVLNAHTHIVVTHVEQVYLLRTRVMPIISKTFSGRSSFNITVHALRLFRLLIRHFLTPLSAEIETAVSLVNQILESNASSLWRRVLCLELYQTIYEDPNLLREMFAQYDEHESRKSLIGDNLAVLVRLAVEKPATIGLGQRYGRSETDFSPSVEQFAIESGGYAGAVTIPIHRKQLDQPGISTRWSTMRTPCIDQADKSDPPDLPATYIYSLALKCTNSFSDGLAKLLLPFTIDPGNSSKRKKKSTETEQAATSPTVEDDEGDLESITVIQKEAKIAPRARRALINPLNLKDHQFYGQIRVSAHMVESCWPALLATSSTFLDASLDSEFYHALVRSLQKFIQVAGLLDLVTPRDAFLTTLAKNAVPSAARGVVNSPLLADRRDRSSDRSENQADSESGSSTVYPSSSVEAKRSKPTYGPVTARNLLCLRALLNLGRALGLILKGSWRIILEALLQLDLAMLSAHSHDQVSRSSTKEAQEQDADEADELRSERIAVDVAVTRLFESTIELPSEDFLVVLDCLRYTIYNRSGLPYDHEKPLRTASSSGLSPQHTNQRHFRFTSISGMRVDENTAMEDISLLLDRILQVADCNMDRLRWTQPSDSGYAVLERTFMDHSTSLSVAAEVRTNTARKLNELILHLLTPANGITPLQYDIIAHRCLDTISKVVRSLWISDASKGALKCSLEIHSMAVGTLNSLLEQGGDMLRRTWDPIFFIVTSVFGKSKQSPVTGDDVLDRKPVLAALSPKLLRLAFDSLQLICSDFLASLPDNYFMTLLDTQYSFCSQDQDLNISLTGVDCFRTISDFLRQKSMVHSKISIDDDTARCSGEGDFLDLLRADSWDAPRSALWIYSLLLLERLTTDDRQEVRHCALHTLFGILEASGISLNQEGWNTCFRLICFKLLSDSQTRYERSSGTSEWDSNAWNDSTVLLVRRLSGLTVQSLGAFSSQVAFNHTWDRFLESYVALLGREHLGLSRSIFIGLGGMLAEMQKTPVLSKPPLESTWMLWRDHSPAAYEMDQKDDNNDALTAYIQFIRQYEAMLVGTFNTTQAEAILSNLRSCIIQSKLEAYSSDVDELTSVQSIVLETLDLIPKSIPHILVQLVQELAFFATLAYDDRRGFSLKGKTFVALSRAAISKIEDMVKRHSATPGASRAQLLAIAFHALRVPICLKYQFRVQGKGIPTWKRATSAVLSVLDEGLLRSCEGSSVETHSLWSAIADINDGIAAADIEDQMPIPTMKADQEFDMESFSHLQKIIIPILGSSSISEKVRRKYVESLFHHSIIHEPHPDDLARPDQELLDGLRSQHIGRVQDLPPIRHSKMAYLLLDQLFDLVAVHDGSAERVKLAQAAAPYLILRVGLVLKAYACDQPLRGRAPQPLSQKVEMHYVLKKLIELDSEPRALPGATAVQSEHKRHLYLLFALVTKALKSAWRDEKMSAALRKVLEAVESDFGS
ncbi:MAG: hypothetical protein Q9220_001193 [cf. Caloplaca sp. 1 TL-2023]